MKRVFLFISWLLLVVVPYRAVLAAEALSFESQLLEAHKTILSQAASTHKGFAPHAVRALGSGKELIAAGSLTSLPIDAYCRAMVQRLDVEQVSVTEEQDFVLPFQKFDPSNPNDNRLSFKGNFVMSDNHEVAFQAVFAPGAWIDGKDILIINSRLQRKEAGGKVTVLVSGRGTSAEQTLPIPNNYHNNILYSSVEMKNPEVMTAILNAGGNLSPYQAVKQGLVPNRTIAGVFFSCFVR